jgi:triosephosphate isomerase
MRQLIAGNWKMNGVRADAIALAQGVREGAQGVGCELLVCPPFTVLEAVAKAVAGSTVAVGGQDCHTTQQGAHTGDVSAAMLHDAGAAWVILGHSERRQNHGETDELVREKVLAAVEAGLVPIVCVGETEEQRSSGQETEVVGWQLAGSLPKPFTGVVAYEPVWAIGTGKTATPEDAQEVCAAIRTRVAELYTGDLADQLRILYGGSVKGGNVAGIMAKNDIDGALVGGASLDPGEFVKICRYRDLLGS